MKSRIVKAIIAVLFVAFTTCAVCCMSACSRDDQNNNNTNTKVTITFAVNGGKEIAPITLERGEELTLPTAEKDGRVFADWFTTRVLRAFAPKQ